MSKQSENYRKHYDWVKKQINLLYPPGGSPSQIVEIAKKRRQEQANLGFEFMKEKIFPQIKKLSNYSITTMQETLHDIALHKPDELVNIIKEFVKETTTT